jgi:hypothetical protein
MSTREFLVQFGPGVILVQLKDGIQVPCGFLGSAGTITHLISLARGQKLVKFGTDWMLMTHT